MKSIELFAGAGGLGMGVTLAGFKSVGVIERDKWACDTIRINKERGFPLVADWPLFPGDVRDWINSNDCSAWEDKIDLVAGGPPCQPFSMGGKHGAFNDARDMFPTTVDVIRKIRPKAFIVENVKGLTRSAFANYYQYIQLQLEFPEVSRKQDETWHKHLSRLQMERTSGRLRGVGLTYNLLPSLVNAADFGIPQRRERVFIVGFRADLGIQWHFPAKTHSLESLLYEQWVSGEYWDRHAITKSKRPPLADIYRQRVRRLAMLLYEPVHHPWRTVRDATSTLPSPEKSDRDKLVLNHRYQAGARTYPGHTGSPMDLPAKTLKAGDHGVPGGENMMVAESGAVRYFTIRESARLQTFPDGYELHGSWSEAMRQLGNAVPVSLAHLVAATVAAKLIHGQEQRIKSTGRQEYVA